MYRLILRDVDGAPAVFNELPIDFAVALSVSVKGKTLIEPEPRPHRMRIKEIGIRPEGESYDL